MRKKFLIISSFSKKENIYKIGKEKAYYKTTRINKKESSAKLVVQISFFSCFFFAQLRFSESMKHQWRVWFILSRKVFCLVPSKENLWFFYFSEGEENWLKTCHFFNNILKQVQIMLIALKIHSLSR